MSNQVGQQRDDLGGGILQYSCRVIGVVCWIVVCR